MPGTLALAHHYVSSNPFVMLLGIYATAILEEGTLYMGKHVHYMTVHSISMTSCVSMC